TETRLDLIDDAEAASRAHSFKRALHVAIGHHDNAAVPLDGLDNHSRQRATGRVGDDAVDLVKVGLRIGPKNSSVMVRLRHDADIGALSDVVPEVPDACDRLSAISRAVIGVPEGNDV